MLPAASRVLRVGGPLDLAVTLAAFRRGGHDPTMLLGDRECWRAAQTPDGPATTHLRLDGDRLAVATWGPGAEWAAEHAGQLAGLDDRDRAFVAHHPVVAELQRRHPGVRIGRTLRVADALVGSVIEQKVTGLEAWRAWAALVSRLGEPAPGPAPLRLAPSASTLAATPSWVFHRVGLERRRSDTIRRAMNRAVRLDETVTMPLSDAYRRMQAFPGVGPWTAAEVARVALGDVDAVSVGDYNLPSLVSWALAGERRGDDDRMLELLDPYRGHRARVVGLLTLAGPMPPRRAPRSAPRAIAAI